MVMVVMMIRMTSVPRIPAACWVIQEFPALLTLTREVQVSPSMRHTGQQEEEEAYPRPPNSDVAEPVGKSPLLPLKCRTLTARGTDGSPPSACYSSGLWSVLSRCCFHMGSLPTTLPTSPTFFTLLHNCAVFTCLSSSCSLRG